MTSVEAALNLARELVHGRGGEKAALSLLEKRTLEDADVYSSAAIWACIAQLRSSLGLSAEAEEAMERASLLRTAPSRKLSFDSSDQVRSTHYMKHLADSSRKSSIGQKRRQSISVRTSENKSSLLGEAGSTSDHYVSEQLAEVRKMSAQCREILAAANIRKTVSRSDLSSSNTKAGHEHEHDIQGPLSLTQARVVQLKTLRECTSNLLKNYELK